MEKSKTCSRKGFCFMPREITGLDVKSYRHTLRMSVDTFAGRFSTSRQNVANLERLTRHLTDSEILSLVPSGNMQKFDPKRHHVTLMIDSRNQ